MQDNGAVLRGAVALGPRQIQLQLVAVAAISQEVLAVIRQVVREEIEKALASLSSAEGSEATTRAWSLPKDYLARITIESPPSAEAESRGKE